MMDFLPLVSNILETSYDTSALYPTMSYTPEPIQNIGRMVEEKRLILINKLIEQRKIVRDHVLKKLDDLSLVCDNHITQLTYGAVLYNNNSFHTIVADWKQKRIDLELAKINEQKELFRDTLFLRNEWIKGKLALIEESTLEKMIQSDFR